MRFLIEVPKGPCGLIGRLLHTYILQFRKCESNNSRGMRRTNYIRTLFRELVPLLAP